MEVPEDVFRPRWLPAEAGEHEVLITEPPAGGLFENVLMLGLAVDRGDGPVGDDRNRVFDFRARVPAVAVRAR